MKKIRVFLEYVAAFLLISILLFSIASAVIVKYYGDEVQAYAMEFVNDQLDTKIAIEEIGISLFRKFPNTSVFLNEVTIWSGHGYNRNDFKEINTDTLLCANKIYLQFNLLDLARKKFNIKGFEVNQGNCKLLIDKNGNSNYAIVRSSRERKSAGIFELQGVQFKNIDIKYINKAKTLDGELLIQNAIFSGNFGHESFGMNTKGIFLIDEINNRGINYLSNQVFKSDLTLDVEKNHFNISKGELILGELIANIEGEFLVDKAHGTDLDLHFSGKRINLGLISEILAKKDLFQTIKGSGNVDLVADISGILAPTLRPHIEASISTEGASLQSDLFPSNIKNISFSGKYSNGAYNSESSSSIEISELKARFEESELSTSILIKDLIDPEFSMLLEGNIQLADIIKNLKTVPFKSAIGSIQPKIKLNGKISGIAEKQVSLAIKPEGEISFQEIGLSPLVREMTLSKFSGVLNVHPINWKLSSTGKFGETDLSMELSSNNVLNYLFKDEAIHLEGKIHGSYVNIDELKETFKAEKTENTENKEATNYPENISANLDFSFDNISFGDLKTQKINGTIIYAYPGLTIKPFYLETLDGSINAQLGLFDLNQSNYQLSFASNLRNIDIRAIFSAFDNFGQDFLSEKNIAGKISGEIDFLSPLQHDFSPITSEIISQSKISITNGELNNFGPMLEMSKFLKIDQLDHIQFSKIDNTIIVKDNIISIPQMDIQSNAFSLNASGTHNFDKTYDYHLGIRLSELLFNKAKSSKKKEFEVALDEEDRRTLFLLLYNEGDGMMIDFDEEQALKKIRNDLKKEKQELKVILKEEFGGFKNNETVKTNQTTTKQPQFNFEFSEESTSDTIPKVIEKKKWWKREIEADKKPDFEFVIDSSDI